MYNACACELRSVQVNPVNEPIIACRNYVSIDKHTHTHTHTHSHTNKHTHTHTHASEHTLTCKQTLTRTHTHTHMLTHTHTHMQTHTPTHTHTHTQTAYHGFPSAPSAITFEPDSQLLAVGTKYGEFRIYGRPGVVFRASTESKAAIKEIFSFSSLHLFITVSEDNNVVLWEIDSEDQSTLTATKEFKLDPDG